MKYSILLLISLYSFNITIAQEIKSVNLKDELEISLKEALNLSIKNNHLLKLNDVKIKEAKANVQEAQERKLPDASVSGSYLFLPINPTVDLKLGNGKFQSPTVRQAIYGSLNSSLPIYAGGKINYAIEAAKYLEQAANLDAQTDKSAIIINTINAYINLYKAHQSLDLVKENLIRSKQRVIEFKNLEINGVIARNELLKVEMQATNMEISLLDAENNYKLSSINMDIMLGLPENKILIPNKDGLGLPTNINSIEEYENLALKNRLEINSLETRKKVAALGIKSTKAGAYPTVALTGGYIAADIPNVLSVYNALNFGVAAKYNIATLWKKDAINNQAIAKLNEVECNELILNDKIKMQINQAYQTYLVSIKKIDVFEKAVLQATDNFNIIDKKFKNGLSTTTELLDADLALYQTNLSVTNAKADTYIAYQNLLNASGLLNEIH